MRGNKIHRLPSIRLQLLALVAAIFAPLAAVSVWIAWNQYHEQREALGEGLVSVARALSAATDRELATGRTLVETLSLLPLVEERRPAELHALALKALASRPGASIVMFDPAGEQIFNTARPYGTALPNVFRQEAAFAPPAKSEVPRGGAQYVRRCFESGRPVYSDLFEGQVTKQYLVAVSVPVVREGKVAYCMTIALSPTAFQALVAAQAGRASDSATIFDARGFLIARAVNPEQYVGHRVPADALEAGRSQRESFARGISVDGKTVLRAVVRSELSGWSAGVSLSEEAAFGAIWRSMRNFAAAALLIFALAVAATLWMARTSVRRLRAEEASEAKDQFLAALSHELRNPLSAIALAGEFLETLLGSHHPGRPAAEIVNRQVGQLRRLLDDLLDTTRAIYGKLNLKLGPVDLHAVAVEIAADYARRPGNPARIEMSGEPAWVRADAARVYQMVDNLVENSIKYGAKHVRIDVHAEGGAAHLSVSDDGAGIAPELMEKLFEPFVQGEQTIERRQGGLGLGLALVRKLVELHGGAISGTSAGKGKGSLFALRLPLGQPAAEESAPGFSAPAEKGEEAAKAAAQAAGRRVLIIEDIADSRESLGALLRTEGFEVALAGDGVEGLEKLRALQPDFAIVDIGLPGMDGYAVARESRKLGTKARLIALTGYGQEDDRRRALEAGFDAHLTKPVSWSELERVLRA